MNKNKVLVIHHHGKFGGSSKSICENILSLKNKFDFEIITPSGSAFDYFKKKKLKVFRVIGVFGLNFTEIGLYKNLRKILIFRELFFLPFTFFLIFKLRKRNYNIIHLNDTNLIILVPILKFFFNNIKILCHIRTRLSNKKFFLKKYISDIINKDIDYLIAIDKSTYSTSYNKKKTKIIYNIFNFKKIIFKRRNNFNVGFLGTLDYHKGVDFLYKTASQIENKKINFIFAGEPSIKNKFLSKILHFLGIKKNIYDVIESNEYKFMTNLIFFGKIYNLEKFYSIIDIICFPSRMNALGRPVIEAASYGIPAIVTLKKYYNDTIISNKTGKIIKFGDIGAFKKNISYFFNNKKKLKLYGRRALRNFKKVHNKEKNLKKLINLYVE